MTNLHRFTNSSVFFLCQCTNSSLNTHIWKIYELKVCLEEITNLLSACNNISQISIGKRKKHQTYHHTFVAQVMEANKEPKMKCSLKTPQYQGHSGFPTESKLMESQPRYGANCKSSDSISESTSPRVQSCNFAKFKINCP